MQKYHFITSDKKEITINQYYLKNSKMIENLLLEYGKISEISVGFDYDEMNLFKKVLKYKDNDYTISELKTYKKIQDYFDIPASITFRYTSEDKKTHEIDLYGDVEEEFNKLLYFINNNPIADKHYNRFSLLIDNFGIEYFLDNTIFDKHEIYNTILQNIKNKSPKPEGYHIFGNSSFGYTDSIFVIYYKHDDQYLAYSIPNIYKFNMINKFEILYRLCLDDLKSQM